MLSKLVPKDEVLVSCDECAIRRMALFKQVPEERLEWTSSYRRGQYTLRAGENLYSEGAEHELVYTLYEGCIKLYKTLKNGKVQAMRFALPGDFLGFQGDFSGPLHHSAQAVTDCTLCAFPREQVSRMLCEHPEIATELIVKNARVMAACQEHLMSTGVRSAREGVAFILAEMNHRLKLVLQYQQQSGLFSAGNLPITQEDLADAVGITPIHANRVLKQMREEGLIACGKKQISILNEEALLEVAHFDQNLIEDSQMF